MRYYYQLTLQTGSAFDDSGGPVAWAACPALPGAYAEATTPPAAREELRALARRILAEHLMRDDPLDPEITIDYAAATALTGDHDQDLLVVAVSDADVEEVRQTPTLMIEQPEP